MDTRKIARRVVARFIGAMEHDSPEALKKYLHEHPDADRSKHTVKKPEKEEGGKAESEGGEGEKKPKSETFKPTQYHKALGNQMQEWQGPGTPAVNTVGSYLSGGHPVPRKKLMEAAKELEALIPKAKAGAHGWTKKDAKALEKMVSHLKNLHDNVD